MAKKSGLTERHERTKERLETGDSRSMRPKHQVHSHRANTKGAGPSDECESETHILPVGDEADVSSHLLCDLVDARSGPGIPESDFESAIGQSIVFDQGEIWTYISLTGVWSIRPFYALHTHVQRYSGTEYWGRGPKGEKAPRPLKVSNAFAGGVINCARQKITVPKFFASRRSGFAFRNGFAEVTPQGVTLTPHSPVNRAIWPLPFDYDEHLSCPRFEAFLSELFARDPDSAEKQLLLAEFVGACLIGQATAWQKVLVLTGQGSNGKTVLLALLALLFPEEVMASISPQDWGDEKKRAALAGKLINIVAELPESKILASEAFKAMVTGDRSSARHLYKDPFDFYPTAGHLFACNSLPGTNDQTYGFWRRFLLVPFNRNFELEGVVRDREEIVAELRQELPGIYVWALKGALRRMRQGKYTVPSSHYERIAEWRLAADQVAGFIYSCTDVDKTREDWSVGAGTLYTNYRSWAATEGHSAMSSSKFRERMLHLNFQQVKHSGMVWKGLILRPMTAWES